MSEKYTVGQIVHRQEFRRSYEKDLPMTQYEITKIGRKWVTVKPVGHLHRWTERFDKEAMYEDAGGYASRARYWIKAEDYVVEKKMREDWGRFAKQFDGIARNRPAHITHEDIAALRAILKLES